MKPVRVRWGRLQTPVREYRTRAGRTVTLIGCCHIGAGSYYEQIHDMAVAREAAGAAVQYEMITRPAEDELAAATAEERAAEEQLTTLMDGDPAHAAASAALRYLGWVSQHDLRYEDTWENVDLNTLELARLALRGAGVETVAAQSDAFDLVGERHLGPFYAASISMVFRFRLDDKLSGVWRRPEADAWDEILVGARSAWATAAVPADRDCVLLWGANHLAGIAAALGTDGCELISERWMTVGRLPGLMKSSAIIWRQILLSLRHRERHPAAGAVEPETQNAPPRPV